MVSNPRTLLPIIVVLLLLTSATAAFAQVVVEDNLTHERSVSRGESYRGAITIRNTNDEERGVRVYQTDYTFDFRGDAHYSPPGSVSRSNSSWISFSPKQFTLAPGATRQVSYTVDVPSNEELSGTYWSVFMVEPAPTGSSASEDQEERGVSVRQVFRFAVQVVTHIEDSGERKLEILDAQLTDSEGATELRLDVENTGERWLRPDVWAEIFTDDGSKVTRIEAGRDRIYPGTSVRYRIDLSTLSAGTYRALVILDGGEESVFGARYNFTIRP